MIMIIKIFLVYCLINTGTSDESNRGLNAPDLPTQHWKVLLPRRPNVRTWLPAMATRLESRAVSLLVQDQRNCDPLVAGLKLLGFSPEAWAECGERMYLKRQMTTSGIEF